MTAGTDPWIKIESAQDLIEALKTHPQFREEVLRSLLTDEFLELPEQVKQIALEQVRLGQELLKHRQEFLQLRRDFDDHRKEFLEHRQEFLQLRRDFDDHRKEFLEHRQEFLELRQDVINLSRTVEHLSRTVAKIGGDVGRLAGKNYEARAAELGRRKLRTILELDRPKFIASQQKPEPLREIADQAADEGRISDPEADDLLLADALYSGTDKNQETIYVLAECSITVNDEDCLRARRRARLLAAAYDIEYEAAVIPAVIAAYESEEFDPARYPEVRQFRIPEHHE